MKHTYIVKKWDKTGHGWTGYDRLGCKRTGQDKNNPPEDPVSNNQLVCSHPGRKSDTPELRRDHRGDLHHGGGDQGDGLGHLLPHCPAPWP